MAVRRQELTPFSSQTIALSPEALGARQAVRHAGDRQPANSVPASDLLAQLALLQQRKEGDQTETGGRSHSRQVITRTTTERLVMEDETTTPIRTLQRSSEPMASVIGRKLVMLVLVMFAALGMAGVLFAVVNSNMVAMIMCMVLACVSIWLTREFGAYSHD